MAKQLKNLIRKELVARFKPVDGGVVVQYRGLDSAAIYDLRTKLHHKGAKLHVVKNALARRAFADLGYDAKKLEALFDGPVGVVYARDKQTGAVGAAKALLDWKKETKDKFVEVKGGFLEGNVIDAAGVKALSDMPSRQQLLGMIAGVFQAPTQMFATALNECAQKFAGVLKALEEKKAKEGGGASPSATPAG